MQTFPKGLGLLLLAAVPALISGCWGKNGALDQQTGKQRDTIHKWVNWVSVFKPGTNAEQRQAVFIRLRNEIVSVNREKQLSPRDSIVNPVKYYLYHYIIDSLKLDRDFVITNIREYDCNCDDSLLWNITADIVTDSSGAVKVSDDAVIAIIDTGIDTAYLDEGVKKNIIYERKKGSRRFITGLDPANFSDNHVMRHGTAVASIAMNAYFKESGSKELPRILALKALDDTGSGTLFDFICALSYAIQQKATVINASMGYYGERNEALDTYLEKAMRDSIPLVAAAGNDTLEHKSPDCFHQLNANNLLNTGHLFFPACNALDQRKFNVISVTGFSSPGMPCYYQNYSENYVTLGVLNDQQDSCDCYYTVPFIDQRIPVSGSSFATPVVSGKLAFRLSLAGRRFFVNEHLAVMGSVLNAPAASSNVTMQNRYINF
jgi:subtilisin family serine protease